MKDVSFFFFFFLMFVFFEQDRTRYLRGFQNVQNDCLCPCCDVQQSFTPIFMGLEYNIGIKTLHWKKNESGNGIF